MRITGILAAASMLLAACGGGGGGTDTVQADDTGDPGSARTGEEVAQEAVETFADVFIPEADEFGVKTFKIVYELEGQQTGTKTLWVEDYGARVGVEQDAVAYRMQDYRRAYWDGEKVHLQNEPDGEISSIGIRPIDTEPSSFARTPPAQLEMVGYARVGEKTIAGQTCEHWTNDALNYDGCHWNKIELEFTISDGSGKTVQRTTAVSFEEGVGVPSEIKAMASAE